MVLNMSRAGPILPPAPPTGHPSDMPNTRNPISYAVAKVHDFAVALFSMITSACQTVYHFFFASEQTPPEVAPVPDAPAPQFIPPAAVPVPQPMVAELDTLARGVDEASAEEPEVNSDPETDTDNSVASDDDDWEMVDTPSNTTIQLFIQKYGGSVPSDTIEAYIGGGKQIYEQILDGRLATVPKNQAAHWAGALTWYLMKQAHDQEEGFTNGSFILQDKDERIFKFLHGLSGTYNRISSHLKGRSDEQHRGIDVPHGFLPNGCEHLLFFRTTLPNREEATFIKPEDHGTSLTNVRHLVCHGLGFVQSVAKKQLPSVFGSDDSEGFRKERVPAATLAAFRVLIQNKSPEERTKLMADAKLWGIGFMYTTIHKIAPNHDFIKKLEKQFPNGPLEKRTGREVMIFQPDVA